MTASLLTISISLGLFGLFLSDNPEEAFLNRMDPIPAHIDMEEVIERLEPIEMYLPIAVMELKTFLWGHNTSDYPEESGLVMLTGFKEQKYVNLILLGDDLIRFYVNFREVNTINEHDQDVVDQQYMHQLISTVINELDINVSLSIDNCVVIPRGPEKGFWEAILFFEYQDIEYSDCVFRIKVHPKLGKIDSLNMTLPLNTPPSLTPVLSKNEAVTTAKDLLLDANYYDVTLPEQLLLYEEPVLRIVDTPWVLVGSSEEDRISPTISKESSELQQARLYWMVPIYANSEISTSVSHFFIDAMDGHYAGKAETFIFGELDPNIPIATFPED